MKTQLTLLTGTLLAWLPLVAEVSPPLSVAVLGLGSTKELEPEAEKLNLLIGVNLSAQPELQMVERVEIDKLIGEQELTLSGTIDQTTAAKIGHMTGAQVLISGRLINVGGKRMAVAKIMGVETSRVVSVSSEFSDAAELDSVAKKMCEDIAVRLKEPKSGLVAIEETWESMIARLKKTLPVGAVLPSVRVLIPEEHISRAVPDPAAQTEVQRVLQELGFKIIEKGPVDFLIEGEAFSERAGQRGQMIFCKARLEVKVTDPKQGKIHVDRQTCAAVDLAENIAGKTALQKAGRSVADRLVTEFFAKL